MVVKAAIGQCWRRVGARLEPKPVQPSDRTADPNSMDGADVWAKTLVQLMAQTKPKDIWELVPQENLASGHLDSSGFQYRLRGLSRCGWGASCGVPGGGVGGASLPRHQPVLDVAWALREAGAACVCLALAPNRWVGGPGAPRPFWAVGVLGELCVRYLHRRRAESLPAGHLQASLGAQPRGSWWDGGWLPACGRLCSPQHLLVSMAALTAGAGWVSALPCRGPERMDPHGGLGPKKEEAVLAWAVAEQGPRREPRGPWVPT